MFLTTWRAAGPGVHDRNKRISRTGGLDAKTALRARARPIEHGEIAPSQRDRGALREIYGQQRHRAVSGRRARRRPPRSRRRADASASATSHIRPGLTRSRKGARRFSGVGFKSIHSNGERKSRDGLRGGDLLGRRLLRRLDRLIKLLGVLLVVDGVRRRRARRAVHHAPSEALR